MAEYFNGRCGAGERGVAPTVNYSYYPAFVEYPGSTDAQTWKTARDMFVENLPGPLQIWSAAILCLNNGRLHHARSSAGRRDIERRENPFDLHEHLGGRRRSGEAVAKQEGGTHADEIETSIMLYIDRLRWSWARRSRTPSPTGALTRDPNHPGAYSARCVPRCNARHAGKARRWFTHHASGWRY